MTPKKKNPAKRGRKQKPSSEKLDQLTVRLPPKIRYGLELLARAQGRSLSQATEWALQVGIRRFDVESKNLGDILDSAWNQPTEPERLMAIWKVSPSLLSFEDRAYCELMSGVALKPLFSPPILSIELEAGDPDREAKLAERIQLNNDVEKNRAALIRDWKFFRDFAVDLANSGHSLKDQSYDVLMLRLRDHATSNE